MLVPLGGNKQIFRFLDALFHHVMQDMFARNACSFIITCFVVFTPISARAAETWTCTYETQLGNQPALIRFELSPPDVIEEKSLNHYHIQQNNEFGLVATYSLSEIETDQKQPTVGARTLVINKKSGELWLAQAITGPRDAINQMVHGSCLKD